MKHCIVALSFAIMPLLGIAAPANPPSLVPGELLAAEDAFKLTARFKDPKTIEISYQITDGYYMYRKRFRASSESSQFKLGKIISPAGKVKQDATFGRVETYRKGVRLLLPLSTLSEDSRSLVPNTRLINLTVISQGCADVGVCYPPLRHQLALKVGSPDVVVPTPQASLSTSSDTVLTNTTTSPSNAVPNVLPGIADLLKKSP